MCQCGNNCDCEPLALPNGINGINGEPGQPGNNGNNAYTQKASSLRPQRESAPKPDAARLRSRHPTRIGGLIQEYSCQ
jgi:hypothetical protein